MSLSPQAGASPWARRRPCGCPSVGVGTARGSLEDYLNYRRAAGSAVGGGEQRQSSLGAESSGRGLPAQRGIMSGRRRRTTFSRGVTGGSRTHQYSDVANLRRWAARTGSWLENSQYCTENAPPRRRMEGFTFAP
eukprot:scaffold2088_cov399-Prasinococcus_capsulatus_cf.AAC.32